MSWTRERARVAALKRHHPDKPEAASDAVRDLRAARLEDHIRRVVDDAPALTAAQLDKLAALLRPPANAERSG